MHVYIIIKSVDSISRDGPFYHKKPKSQNIIIIWFETFSVYNFYSCNLEQISCVRTSIIIAAYQL